MQLLAALLFTVSMPDMKTAITLGYSVPRTAPPPFDLGRNPLSLIPKALLATGSLFLLLCFSGKTRSADQLQHAHENERKTCLDVDNLLRKGDQQLSLFAGIQGIIAGPVSCLDSGCSFSQS